MTPMKATKRKATDLDETIFSGSESGSPRKLARQEENAGPVWTSEECRDLVAGLISQNKSLLGRNYRSSLNKVDWSTLTIGEHDADSVRTMAEKLVHEVRRHRTLQEVLDDCAKAIEQKKIGKLLVAYPKRPPSAYMEYYRRHLAEIKELNPGAALPDLAKAAAAAFRDLPEKKKKKYQDRYEGRKEDFAAQMAQIKTEHPEIFPEKKEPRPKTPAPTTPSKSKSKAAQKPKTPKKIRIVDLVHKPRNAKQNYVDTQVEGKLKKHPEKSREDLVSKFTKKWSKMSEEDKEPWALLAVEQKLTYEKELLGLRDDPRFSSADLDKELTKASNNIHKQDALLKLADMGRPKTPPTNGFLCFLMEYLDQNIHEGKVDMTEMGRQWKALGEGAREKYKSDLQKQHTAYKVSYDKWRKALSAEEMELALRLEKIALPKKKEKEEKVVAKKAPKEKTPAGEKMKIKLPAFMRKDERQTTIDQHFSPGPSTVTVDSSNDDEEESSTSTLQPKENQQGHDNGHDNDNDNESDSFHSPSENSDDFKSLEDFQPAAKIKPRLALNSVKSPSKKRSAEELSPHKISPFVNNSNPIKKSKK